MYKIINIDKILTLYSRPNLNSYQIAIIYNYDYFFNFEKIYNLENNKNSKINLFLFSNNNLDLQLEKNEKIDIFKYNNNFIDTYDAINKIGNKLFFMSDYIIIIKN